MMSGSLPTSISESTISYETIRRRDRFRRNAAGFINLAATIIFWGPAWLLTTYDGSSWRAKWKTRKKDRHELVPPTPRQRGRALTISSNKSNLKSDREGRRRTLTQNSSPLMRLPAEVRNLIWEKCVGSDNIYILLSHGRWRSFRQHGEQTEPVERLGEAVSDIYKNIARRDALYRRNVDVLPLLQTCRKIYSEAITTVYQTAPFTFCDIHSFLAFYACLPPSNIPSLGHINLDFHALWPNGVIHPLELVPPHDRVHADPDYHVWSSINERVNYRVLNNSRVRVYNALPRFDKNACDAPDSWRLVCEVLGQMRGLRELRVRIHHERYTLRHGCSVESTFFEPLREVLGMGMGMGIERVEVDVFAVDYSWRPEGDAGATEHGADLDSGVGGREIGGGGFVGPPEAYWSSLLPSETLRWTRVGGEFVWSRIEDQR
ncbi:hypothetical protein K491DRAFT_455841 [Lophiostoma macrostomum CBS 122681]|uniref:DUF7730 domain-containing protein n=1 Tax=Lophiostoma macrostomum CBS 122681 TaxID=1314788 RepID=A0A6A6T7I4_9PLEO|nr:hypothetical protein K491DRAFT_455841 [Lophiostoma macrostomum CBS 122681]